VDDEAHPVVCIVSHVVNLRPRRRRPYDWAVDELSPFDVRLILAALAAHDVQAVRDAGHRLDHHLRRTGTSPAGAGRPGVPRGIGSQRLGVIDPDGGAA
jgi:hypothetical protein